MKAPEELNALREEVETLNRKLAELNMDELRHVTGGVAMPLWDGASAGLSDNRSLQDHPDLSGTVYARIVRICGDEREVSPWYTLSELAEILPTITGQYKIEYLYRD